MSPPHEDTAAFRPTESGSYRRRMSMQIRGDVKSFHRGITFGAGDFVALCSLFFDNLSTLLGFSGAILALNPTNACLQEILYRRIIPAAGIMLFLGNIYYAWMAVRMARKYQRAFTAQPYGFNTAGGFPFIFGIIYGVYYSHPCASEGADCTLDEENARIELAWKVCVSANFLTGVINIVLGFFGELIMNYFPVGAMLVPLSGIGFTWLALNQIAPNFAVPAIGLVPIFFVFTQYYARGRIHIAKGFYVPEAVPIVLFGVIAGWAYGTQGAIVPPVKAGIWIGGAFYQGFSDIGPYMGVVLPFSIAASFLDMMCLVSAQKAGDPYPIRETMISDGIGTLIGAILGSPFGTVIYIGHPAHKRVGAQTGYSFMNGCIYLILCLTGAVSTILSIIPVIAVGPIILVFGLMSCEECTKHMAERHHSGVFFGLFFGVCDYIFTQFQGNAENNPGPLAMSRGSALTAMLWVAIIVYTTDRRWKEAGLFCVIAAFFAGSGLIHQAQAYKDFFIGTGGNPDSTSAFQFMIGYLSMGAVCFIYWVLQVYSPKTKEPGEPGYEDDHGYLPELNEGDVDRLFDSWWDPAEKGLAIATGEHEISQTGKETKADLNEEDPEGNFESFVSEMYKEPKEVKEAIKDVE